MSQSIKFEYGPQWRTGMMVAGFFGPCTVALAFMAKENSAGLTIKHMIELSAGFATIFLWALVAFSALFSLAGVYSLYLSLFTPKHYIEISADAITVPAMLFRPAQYIRLADIICGYETLTSGVRTYTLHGTGGKVAVSHPHFKNRAQYEEFLQVIAGYFVRVGDPSL